MFPAVHISSDPTMALADRLAELIARSVTERGLAVAAVSGGSSPVAAFDDLGRRPLPWDRVHLFQVDERVAPDGDPDRNLVTQRRSLPDAVWHPMAVAASEPRDLAAVARDYGRELRSVAGAPPVLDVVHLGLGADGHTASWPPGRALPAGADVSAVEPFNGRARLTLTPECINRARTICWLVPGAGRQLVLGETLAGAGHHPATAVRRSPRVEVFTDRWPVARLDLSRDDVTEGVVALQRAAYSVEAALIGYDAMPGLHESADELVARDIDMVGAWQAGELVGAIGYRRLGDGVVDVDRLVVAPSTFRRGVGSSLVLALHDIEHDARCFEVSTAVANLPAIALYERCGYAIVGTERSDGVEIAHLRRTPSPPATVAAADPMAMTPEGR